MLVVVAYALGVAGLVYFLVDSSRIPRQVWFWSGYSRPAWVVSFAACLVALGIPALIAAIVWRFGEARRTLLREVDELRRAGRTARRAEAEGSPGNLP
jgi:hypothetical protein